MTIIKADPKNGGGFPRDDEYDNDTIRWYEENNKHGYFHELYVLIDDVKAAIVITNYGVSVNYLTRESIHTNIIPERLFEGKKKLSWREVAKIVDILEKTGIEGKFYSKEEMESEYKLFKRRLNDQNMA